jgi:hypothetical protein
MWTSAAFKRKINRPVFPHRRSLPPKWPIAAGIMRQKAR